MLKYRNSAESFWGDPRLEARSEVLDLWNYAGEMRRQGEWWWRCALIRLFALAQWRLL